MILTSGTYTTPNAAGLESGHADVVGNNFYGNAASGPYPYSDPGAAPGVSTIDNYQADYYYDNLIAPNVLPSSISSRLHNARVVNQSFTFGAQYTEVDEQYDNYADLYNVLFVSAIGNGSPANPGSPSSCYNGIAVACIDLSGTPTVGPTADGRCKPDITAPGGYTSYSTPYVSGCAAILMQAAARGDGGAGTQTNAGDIRTVKALLLNERHQAGRLEPHQHSAARSNVWRRRSQRVQLLERIAPATRPSPLPIWSLSAHLTCLPRRQMAASCAAGTTPNCRVLPPKTQ